MRYHIILTKTVFFLFLFTGCKTNTPGETLSEYEKDNQELSK